MGNVTLLGLGTVGSEVARACAAPGSRWTVQRAFVRDARRERTVALPEGVLTTSADEALDGVGPVVEVLGGEQPAADLIAAALDRGRPVVTANKMAIAAQGPRLFALARWNGVALGIEACVGGGVPVVAALRHLAGGQRLTAIDGVLNGTTNAILGAMEAGQSYVTALAGAQAAGFAEPDPTADVGGYDAAAKLAILAALAFRRFVDPLTIPRRPLVDVGPADLDWAARHGARVKYLASIALLSDDTLGASVEPVAVLVGDALAKPEGPGNAIRISGELIGMTTLSGPGAGAAPTAGAILGDLAALADGPVNLSYPDMKEPPARISELVGSYAVRLPESAMPATLSREAHWTRDGNDWIGLIRATTGTALRPAVRAAGGTLLRWDVEPWS